MPKQKILSLSQAVEKAEELRRKKKKLVLAGGVFDIFHYGHFKFLQAAKKQGGALIIALESDKNVKRRKGKNRPFYPQNARAEILAGLTCVDYVVNLPEMKTDQDYYQLVQKLQPNLIAVSQNDPQIKNKKKQALFVRAQLKVVTPQISTPSTSRLLSLLSSC